jgi:hypothetical protein
VIEAALDKAIAILAADSPDRGRTSATSVRRRLSEVERELANLAETAARGGAVPVILEALNRADAERRTLERELAEARNPSRIDRCFPDARELRRTLRGYLDDWHTLIRGNVTQARELLQAVLLERIVFRPITGEKGAPMYELTIPIAFDRLLVSIVPGLQARVGLASPTGATPYCVTGRCAA